MTPKNDIDAFIAGDLTAEQFGQHNLARQQQAEQLAQLQDVIESYESDISRRRGRDRLYERSRPSRRAGFHYIGVFPLIGTGGGIGGLGRS